jgi:hypothetical protein
MSIQAVAWVLDREELPARPKLVLVAIANHANHTDGYCWLKAETIAREAACSPRAVFNFVGALIRNGYIRKAPARGADGKQRANDYWILFNRAEGPWIAAEGTASDDQEEIESADDAAEYACVEVADEPQDVVEPHAPGASGEPVEKPPQNPAQHAPGAVGPHAPACSHIDSAEPSKTKPEKAGLAGFSPRRYAPPPPPPPQPMGATTAEGNGDFIFVWEGTEAYRAWKVVKEREIGRPWNGRMLKDGRWGWYFRSLFPPAEKPPPTKAADETAIDPPFSKTG